MLLTCTYYFQLIQTLCCFVFTISFIELFCSHQIIGFCFHYIIVLFCFHQIIELFCFLLDLWTVLFSLDHCVVLFSLDHFVFPRSLDCTKFTNLSLNCSSSPLFTRFSSIGLLAVHKAVKFWATMKFSMNEKVIAAAESFYEEFKEKSL